MKNLLLILVVASFFAIEGGTHARAQVVDSIVADIPFGFTVRNTTLPAGEYTINRLDSVNPGIMVITSADHSEKLAFLVVSVEGRKVPDQTKLIFDHVGDQYFLSEILEEGSSIGAELKRSHAEQQMEREGAIGELRSITVPGHLGAEARR